MIEQMEIHVDQYRDPVQVVTLMPGERILSWRYHRALIGLWEMAIALDKIEIHWPIPEAVSFPGSINMDCFSRRTGS